MRDTQGQVVGVGAIKVEGEAVLRVLRGVNASAKPAQTFLVNADGIVIAHPSADRLYRSLGDLSPQRIEAIQARSRFPVSTLSSLGLSDMHAAVVGASAPGYLSFVDPGNGVPSVMGFAPLTAQGRTLCIDEPREVFAAPLNRLFHGALASVLVMGGLVALVALLLGRRLVQPLRSLTQVTRRLSEGTGPAQRAAPAADLRRLGAGRDDEIGVLARHIESIAVPEPGPEDQGPAALPSGRFRLDGGLKERLMQISRSHRDEIGQLAHTFDEMVAQLQVYIDDLKTVTAAKATIEGEMRLAAGIQHSLLPSPEPLAGGRTQIDLHAFMHPARQVGGDLYDDFYTDPDRLFFAIGDVSDKGMPAALFMGRTLALLRSQVKPGRDLAEVFAELNRTLSLNNDACQLVTLLVGILDLPSGEVVLCNGGHNLPYRRRAGTGAVERVGTIGGVAVGCFDQAPFRTHRLRLDPGDTLFAYTNGVTEAESSAAQLFGDARLESCLAAADAGAAELVSRVEEELRRFVVGAPQSDDIAMLCLRLPALD